MESLDAQQSILGTSGLIPNQTGFPINFADPFTNSRSNPSAVGQGNLPVLIPQLAPVNSTAISNSTAFLSTPFSGQNPSQSVQINPLTSGIDLLTGTGLNTSSIETQFEPFQSIATRDFTQVATLQIAEAATRDALQQFFNQPDWQTTFQEVFGKDYNQDRAQTLATAFAQGDFSTLPSVEILNASVLNGARGGFDTAANKIYLSDSLLSGGAANSALVKSVLLEEIGHSIDAQVNQLDTPGDEGELFADRVQRVSLSNTDLLSIKTEDDHAAIWLNGAQHLIEEASALPNFAIRTESTLRLNSGGDLDGDPLNLQDDALVYAAKGFAINGSVTLPVQYNANGTPIRDASGKLVLVPDALSVAAGYTSSQGPSSTYAGVNPPTVLSPQTVNIPLYADLLNQTLSSRIPSGTPDVTFNAQTPINSASDWASKFPAGGTATRPTVVHVINGGLNIPSNAVLKNLVIKVDSGSINFNGTGHTLNNVMLVASNGSVNLSSASATNFAVFASGAINANGPSQLTGSNNLFATGTSNGAINFSGSTATSSSTDQLQIVAQGSINFNGTSNLRTNLLSARTISFNGSSNLFGSIGAKGDITFNGSTTVTWALLNGSNQAPTDLALSSSSVAENVSINTVVGNLSTTDPNSGDTFIYSLVSGTGATDNAAFAIVGNQLQLQVSPNFEAQSSYSIRVRTTDQGRLSYDKVLTVSITDVNEAPTNLILSNATTPENVAAGSVIGAFTASDPDANNTFTYSLVSGTGSTDNAAFNIVGNQLKINASPNFEAQPSYSIRVRTTDQGGLSYDKVLTVSITDVNEAPTNLVLSNVTTPENVAAGSVIGAFTTTEPDANSTFTYSLVAGTGSTDNAAFSIVGNQLKINSSPNFEAQPSYKIRVRTTDQGGLSYEQALTVSITDVNEAPTSFVLSNSTTPENVLAGSVIGAFTTADPDVNNTFTYSLVTGTGSTDNAAFNIAGNQLKINASPNFESKSSYSIRVRTTDQGGLNYEKVLAISVTDLNEAPTSLILSNATTPENVAAGSVIGSFTTADPDANNTFTYSLVAGTGDADNAAFSVVGNQLKINASPDFEAKSSYSICVRTTDQGGLSYDKALTINITDVNEAPTNLVLSNNTTPENVAPGSIIGNFSTTDSDANNTFIYSLVAGTGDVDNSVFSLVGNQLKINASPDFESKSSYSVRVRTTDQGGLSFDKVFPISITNVNEAPTQILLAGDTVPENSLSGTVVGQLSTQDPDAGDSFTYQLLDDAAGRFQGNVLDLWN